MQQSLLNVTNKVCPNLCSNNGTCIYTSILTGNTVDDCSILSSTCIATCDCATSMYGSDCSLTSNELYDLRTMQYDTLSSLNSIVSGINTTRASSSATTKVLNKLIPITADIISSLSIDTSIPTDTISLTKAVLLTTLDYSSMENVDASSLLVYTNAISSITPLTISNTTTTDSLIDIQDLYESYVDTLFAVFSRRQQGNSSSSAITTTSDNMITVIKTVEEDNEISSLGVLPHNIQFTNVNRRRILSSSSSSVSLTSISSSSSSSLISLSAVSSSSSADNTIGISVIRSYLYKNEYHHCNNCTVTDKVQNAIVSNPLRVSLNCSQYTTSSTNTIITIQNYEYQSYRELNSLDEYNTTCSITNTTTTYVYTCHYPDDTNYNISITCSGKDTSTYITKCPTRRIVPSCHMVASSSSSSYDSCSVVSFMGSTLTCSCSLCSSYNNRKLITNSITSSNSATAVASYRIASVTQYVFDDYIHTMSSSSSVNEQTFLVTLTITIAYAVLWSTVVVIVIIQTYREKRSSNKKKEGSIGSITSVVPDNNRSSSTNDDDDDAKKTFKDYIISYFPSIYKSEVDMVTILTSIVSKHKYFSLLSNTTTNSSTKGYSNRYVNALHLISIISANMFVLAMLFDLRSVSPSLSSSSSSSSSLLL